MVVLLRQNPYLTDFGQRFFFHFFVNGHSEFKKRHTFEFIGSKPVTKARIPATCSLWSTSMLRSCYRMTFWQESWCWCWCQCLIWTGSKNACHVKIIGLYSSIDSEYLLREREPPPKVHDIWTMMRLFLKTLARLAN